jgi:ATP-dependent Clp protease ATP-binding subunit ClpA
MFSRFSPASRRILRAAEQECRNHNHYYVGAEHVLLALLEEHDPAIGARLASDHIDFGEVHAEARRALGMGEDRSWEGILVTPRVRKIVALAETRAQDRDVEPLDLFEAIREEGGGLAADILRRAAVAEKVTSPIRK